MAISLPLLGGFAALCIEFIYLRVVQQQLQGVSDTAAHAANLIFDGTEEGLDAARLAAVEVAEGSWVDGRAYTLAPEAVEFGYYDADTQQFTETDVVQDINAVRVPLTEPGVGLGFGSAFFGKTFDVHACSAVVTGDGNASTGEVGGPGLANGHFDADTTAGTEQCPGSSSCDGTSKHTHKYDDQYDVTSMDLFSDAGDHFPIDGCVDESGKVASCADAGASPLLGEGTAFKLIVANADLSRGAWLTINGVDVDVIDYDDTPFEDLPTYELGIGAYDLSSLTVNFDIDAIANCELLPTNTGDVKSNSEGIYGEWRSGALTIQAVRPDAVTTPGKSNGTHDVVVSEDDGLLWEATFFWHWDGPSYTRDDAEDWLEAYDQLDCGAPEFVGALPGSSAC